VRERDEKKVINTDYVFEKFLAFIGIKILEHHISLLLMALT